MYELFFFISFIIIMIMIIFITIIIIIIIACDQSTHLFQGIDAGGLSKEVSLFAFV